LRVKAENIDELSVLLPLSQLTGKYSGTAEVATSNSSDCTDRCGYS